MSPSDKRALITRLRDQALRAPLSPGDAMRFADAAAGYAELGEAIGHLDAALRTAPGDAKLLQWRGYCQRERGALPEAVADFTEAAQRRPNDPLIVHSLARARMEAGLPAVANYAHLRGLAPLDPAIALGLARALVIEGRAEDAIAGLDQVLATAPGWIDGHQAVSEYRWTHGRENGARFTVSLDSALTREPGNLELWRCKLGLLLQAQRYDALIAASDSGERQAGAHPMFTVARATAWSELGDPRADDAFAAVDAPEDISVAVRRIRHWLRTGRTEEAARECERWLSHPRANMVWPYAATAWRLTGDHRHAWLEGEARLVGEMTLPAMPVSFDAVAARLRAIHIARQAPVEQSLRKGTQTEGVLFHRCEPELRALATACREAVRGYIDQLPPIDPAHPVLRHRRDEAVRFAGSWSVRLTDAGFHVSHYHPMGWISSACYLAVPPDLPAGEGELVLGQPPAELGLTLPPIRIVQPAVGKLALFPSIMWHGTRPFGRGERMTAAFDVMPPE